MRSEAIAIIFCRLTSAHAMNAGCGACSSFPRIICFFCAHRRYGDVWHRVVEFVLLVGRRFVALQELRRIAIVLFISLCLFFRLLDRSFVRLFGVLFQQGRHRVAACQHRDWLL